MANEIDPESKGIIRAEYNQLQADIIARFGEPQYINHKPANIAAEKILKLKGLMLLRRTRKITVEELKNTIADIRTSHGNVPFEVPIPEELLLSFTELEKAMIKAYFSKPHASYTDIAQFAQTPREAVFKFINSKSFAVVKEQILEAFKESLPYEALVAVRDCIRSGDISTQKLNAALAVLEDSGIIKRKADVELNIYNNKIEDPLAEEELRKLGDRLANAKHIPLSNAN